MNASQRWKNMVEAEHAQSERMREAPPPQDHWQHLAEQFIADPHREDDPLVQRLLTQIEPEDTIIDVGAGAGRLALPLALNCQHVAAVEPSPSMGKLLIKQASEHRIENISLIQAGWEEAEVDRADKVLCAHVLYTVSDIGLFVDKLEAHARTMVMVVLFKSPPQSNLYSIWRHIHWEERLPLPSLPELVDVLEEMGIEPILHSLPSHLLGGFDKPEDALEQLTRRLFLDSNGAKRRVLETVLPGLLEEVDGTYRTRGTQPLEPAVISWKPRG